MKNNEVECQNYIIEALLQKNNGEIVFDNVQNINMLLNLLQEAALNPNATEFPDFISDKAIIEHFSITSSKESKKGSSFKIEQIVKEKESEETIKSWQEDCAKLPSEKNTIRSNVIENTYDDLTYENFLKSLEKNIVHHIDSLKKNSKENKKVIFLIELQDALMGIYRNNAFYKFYELNRDKNALKILNSYKGLLDFIIFRASDKIEIIDVKKFDSVYRYSYVEKDVRGGRNRDITILLNVNI